MNKEKRDLYDCNLNKTDKFYYKGNKVPENYYPLVVMIVIQNYEGKFLIQKRVEEKGGDWGVTGGHPKYGQTPIEGIIEEVKEELGVDISNEKIEKFDYGCDGKECYIMYFVKLELDIKNIKIQEEELTEVRWFSLEEMKDMVKTKELNENQISCFEKYLKYKKEANIL